MQAVNSGRYPRKLQKGSEEAIQDSRIHRETENHCVQWGFGPGWGTLGDSIEDTFDLFTPREMRELEFVFFNYLGHCLKAASGSSSPWSWFGCPCMRGRGSSQVVISGACPRGYGQCTMVWKLPLPQKCHSDSSCSGIQTCFPPHPEECTAMYSLIQAAPAPHQPLPLRTKSY